MSGQLSELLGRTISNNFYQIDEKQQGKTTFLLAKTTEEIDMMELYDFIEEVKKHYKYICSVIGFDEDDGSLTIDVEVEA